MTKTQATKRQTTHKPAIPNDAGREGKPISLSPLSFDEALDGLLGVKPEPKVEPKAAKKRATKKG